MGTGKIGKVHDSFFKKVFNDEQNIRDFFKLSLPAEIYSEINLNDLDIDNTNYIDDSLKEHLSDIVIKTKLKSDKEQEEIDSDIYVLFEHKSLQLQASGIKLQAEQFLLNKRLYLLISCLALKLKKPNAWGLKLGL